MIEKYFKFIKNTVDFIKIVILFFIIMLLLYWTQNLAGANWAWIKLFTPILDGLINFSAHFSDSSFKLFAATFEIKYFIALCILIVLYIIISKTDSLINSTENLCNKGCDTIRKQQEMNFNRSLVNKINEEQSKINSYSIFVTTSLKPSFSHSGLNVDINEENKIMNKFIIEKTGINPSIYENGFLYTFNSFNHIDSVLEVFFKIVKSNSKLDYTVCVQIITENKKSDSENLNKLKGLNYKNRIYMMSETTYRYKFKTSHRYGTSKIGVFQKENGETFEVDEFIEI